VKAGERLFDFFRRERIKKHRATITAAPDVDRRIKANKRRIFLHTEHIKKDPRL
jgi:hypothetical protein